MREYNALNFDVNIDTDGLVVDLDSLHACLAGLSDRRHARGMRYGLATILVLVVLAKLTGEDRLSGIAEWVAHRVDMLASMLHWVKARAPHRTTYSRVLGQALDIDELEQEVGAFFAGLPNAGRSVLIALDGKTLRGTIPAGQKHGRHLLAAYLPQEGWVCLQVEVGRKENEISAAPRVLACLDLRGKVVTGDALLAQRALSVQIVEAGGDYVWSVKDNQSQTRQDIALLFEPEACGKGFSPALKDFRTAQTIDKGHGRIERRRLTISSELSTYLDWPYAQQVFKLERDFTRVKDGKRTHVVVYGLTSLSAQQADPQRLLALIRGHWGIENGLHYRRDESLREDWCHLRIGHAPHAMAVINNLLLGLLARQGHHNVPKARRYYAAHLDQALKLICASLS